MSEICELTMRYQITVGGAVIEHKSLHIAPESITIRPAAVPPGVDGEARPDQAPPFRIDVKQHDGNHLAWLVLPTSAFYLEVK